MLTLSTEFPMQKVQNHAPISPFSSRISRFIGKIRENGRTYPLVIQNSLCLPALKHITRFADAKSR